MQENKCRKECGSVEVEATIILPITILSVILLLYLSLFMFQRANLQACLETALVYYKNTATDTYVTQNEELGYSITDEKSIASGNSYLADRVLNPYRGGVVDIISSATGGGGELNLENKEKFETYFRSIAGNMLFDDNLELTIDYNNYLLYRQLKVTATQTVQAPINFDILGVSNEYVISATAFVNVVDGDSMIRNVDYALDLLEDSPLSNAIGTFASKFKELYQKMKDALGVK